MLDQTSILEKFGQVASKGVSRILKRELLEELGFPLDQEFTEVTAFANDWGFDSVLSMCGEDGMYLVTYLPKGERLTFGIPPFFEIVSPSLIFTREGMTLRRVDRLDVVNAIARAPKGSRIFKATRIWRRGTVAGRLMYIDRFSQKMELELGSVPRVMGLDPNRPAAVIDLCEFTTAEKSAPGTLQHCITSVCKVFTEMTDSFERLKCIGASPTIEFAFDTAGNLFVVDVDWANQWSTN
jgi:hypothetical protein